MLRSGSPIVNFTEVLRVDFTYGTLSFFSPPNIRALHSLRPSPETLFVRTHPPESDGVSFTFSVKLLSNCLENPALLVCDR